MINVFEILITEKYEAFKRKVLSKLKVYKVLALLVNTYPMKICKFKL